MKLRSSRDVIIRTDAWDKAVEFYTSILDLAVTHRSKTLMGFSTGAFCLYVEKGAPHGPVFDFIVTDIQAAKHALVAAGCVVLEENPRVPRCYLADPFGLVFNLGQAPKSSQLQPNPSGADHPPVPVEALNCPSCGAPLASDVTSCSHCGSHLSTTRCPGCFALMFVGQKFCLHCGVKTDAQEADPNAKPQLCPRCRTTPMNPVVLGGNQLRECPKCEGLWTDPESLRQICADREKQAAVLGLATTLASGAPVAVEQKISYLPCPICRKLMNRVNFASYSGVIVDVCREHGTWFDHDELRRIVEFIRVGGLDQARAREIANLEEERRLARISSTPLPNDDSSAWPHSNLRYHGISLLADVLFDLFK